MKNIIKSLTSFLLTAFLLLSFSACLGGNSEENDIRYIILLMTNIIMFTM